MQGAKNVCDAARKYGIKNIIFTSTVAIYGFAMSGVDESGEPNYFNEYGKSKYEAEQVYRDWYSEDPENRSLVIVRPTAVFGEGNRGNVYTLFKQIKSGYFVMFGNGKNLKSISYVENVAGFLVHCLSIGNGYHLYNYADKPDVSMERLVSLTRKVLFGKDNVGVRLPSAVGISLGYIADVINLFISTPLSISSIRVKKFLADSKFLSAANSTGYTPLVPILCALEKTIKSEFSKKK